MSGGLPEPVVAAESSAPGGGGSFAESLLRRVRPTRESAIWYVTILLFAVSPLLAAGTLGSQAINSMLPFWAVLAIASLGQMLVIQQGGLDLSVPGMISLAAVIATKYPGGADDKIFAAIVIVLLAGAVVGLLNGISVVVLGVTPFVATLAINALLIGAAVKYSEEVPVRAPEALSNFFLDKTFGIPNTVLIALGVIVLMVVLMKATVFGRRAEAVGANDRAAHAVGLPVARYRIGAYMLASVLYAAAGLILAGFLQTPGLEVGQTYLLSTIAAVVLGGMSLGGGRAAVATTVVGALFLSQLNQITLAMGASTATQFLVQGSIIGLGMGLRNVSWRGWSRRLRTRSRAAPRAPAAGAADS